ncbi:acyltransferase family protein [Pseudoduganella violaceinigra]|uniref:acyltransferase family protein n=1 Tax=Pseudoduganella violaceinigra TaxID=246602 RepID=UPI00040C69D1|nr:acyltransferase [Pseudoduganella violaceinigra]
MTNKPNLDLLRAVAVLFVLFAHVFRTASGHAAPATYAMGQLGVMIFFVHTSLVLMQSLERQQASGTALFKRFYIQRICRIYPLSMTLVLGIYFLMDQNWTHFELFANLALVQDLTYARLMSDPLWSLPLEVQMYCMLPFLFVFFRHRPLKWLLACWLLTLPLTLVPTLLTPRLDVLSYIPCFLGGVIAWRLQDRERLPAWLWPLTLAVFSLVYILFAETRANFYSCWALCLALGLTIPWMRQLRTPALNYASKTIAKYSYGIYLFHYPMLALCFDTLAGRHPVLQWGLFWALMVVLPFLGYHLIEHPMIKVGAAWCERKATGAGALTAA